MGSFPRAARVAGVGVHLPPRRVTNFDLQKTVDTSDEWIRTRTGISERRVSDPELATSDLASAAARHALRRARIAPEEVDLIMVATVTPDHLFPASSCLVQENIGATHAAAFDLEAGCTGFVYALAVGSQFIAAGSCDTVLVVGAEQLSKVVDWQDRATCVLFGDGAGAAVLRASEKEGILGFALFSDGSRGHTLELPAGGSRFPATEETVRKGMHYLAMDGHEVFRFAIKAIPEALLACCEKVGLSPKDLDLVIPHQANTRILEAAAKRLDMPQEKFFSNLDRYGNTSTASIPIALYEAAQQGRLKRGSLVALVGFGAGLTWGALALRW